MKQYRFTGYTWDKCIIDHATINANNYKEALQHARFLIAFSIVKSYTLKMIRWEQDIDKQ